jgi:RHH-type transcriptional regulator, rel operon repressor / antitoxin RelB
MTVSRNLDFANFSCNTCISMGEITLAVSLRLPEDLSARLDKLAKRTGRSKTYYMIEAIREQIGDLEDIYLAEKELEDIKAGRSKLVSLDDVMKSYDVEN